jgi:hypothetical protein
MKGFPVLAIVSVLAASQPAIGACRLDGTQLRCAADGQGVVIGTQTDDAASGTSSAPVQGFQPGIVLPDMRAMLRSSLDIHLQDFSDDPLTCQRYGDETYCY